MLDCTYNRCYYIVSLIIYYKEKEGIIIVTSQDYAIYKGDQFLFIGNKWQCATFLGVSPNTFYFYTMPAYARRVKDEYSQRIIVIKIEEEENE